MQFAERFTKSIKSYAKFKWSRDYNMQTQLNLNGPNIFGTVESCSRYG